MSEVKVKENESLDSALRRFKRTCARDGIMGEVRKREHYDKPSVKRKRNPKPLENVNSDNRMKAFSVAVNKMTACRHF